MPPTPDQLIAQANAAGAQAAAKARQAGAVRAEAAVTVRLLDPPLAGMGDAVWRGGAARTCHAEADDHRGWLRNVRDHLNNWADILDRQAADARNQAARNRQNAAVVQQWQAACAAAAAAVPPQPPPPPPALCG